MRIDRFSSASQVALLKRWPKYDTDNTAYHGMAKLYASTSKLSIGAGRAVGSPMRQTWIPTRAAGLFPTSMWMWCAMMTKLRGRGFWVVARAGGKDNSFTHPGGGTPPFTSRETRDATVKATQKRPTRRFAILRQPLRGRRRQ